jgi:GNAT superfamily N-acetyltransferase/DNA-binding MarR family transcriptional regulator
MDALAVQQVRGFNRTVADRIGALSDHFLGRGRPMGESRTLWEIGPEGVEIRRLRQRLGMDSGYTSRVLRSLTRQGLIEVTSSPVDGRVRLARLTAAGLRERAELDHRADDVAWGFLEPLQSQQREQLVAAMRQVERLLRISLLSIAVEDPTSEDARWCIAQYFAELNQRFEDGFDPGLGISAAPHELSPPHGLLLLARARDQPVGCGALKFHPGAPTELKRMWVSPDARGLGLGRRLLGALEQQAQAVGSRMVRLETNRVLVEAIQMYRASGYREVARFNDEPYAHHWFEKALD